MRRVGNLITLGELSQYEEWAARNPETAKTAGTVRLVPELVAAWNRVELLIARLHAIQSWRLSANLTPEQDAALAVLSSRAPADGAIEARPDTKSPSEMRVGDAALRLAMSRERVIRLVQAHKIRGRRDPWGGWLVDVSSIDAFLKSKGRE